ncbi:hypothetical protein RND71_012734 [Anisodus tanguticus]|uniref:Uncharacterized protein n=1 Tax=Anisodus tanguticus TaxID=243964 RepID=A0AAE1SGB2_9SOLA|nr:hypothetical protein RND71_012734 [Anisodus tanguticus]
MSWAESRGGVSFTRHHPQGRIEGNIEKLRAEHEKVEKKFDKEVQLPPRLESPPMPPAPMVLKRKRRLIDESEDVGGLARKLGDEFDKVVEESESKGSGMKVEAIAGRNEDVAVEVINQVKSKGESMKMVESVVAKCCIVEILLSLIIDILLHLLVMGHPLLIIDQP